MMDCPIHKTELLTTTTRYGLRHFCPVGDCTVVCWGNETSTPADYETRQLRHKLHQLIMPIWRRKEVRWKIYSSLQQELNLMPKDAHIGMLTKEQCIKAKPILKRIVAERVE